VILRHRVAQGAVLGAALGASMGVIAFLWHLHWVLGVTGCLVMLGMWVGFMVDIAVETRGSGGGSART